MNPYVPALLLSLLLIGPPAPAAEPAAEANRQYVGVSIDRLVIETAGLTRASGRLAESIEQLAAAIEELAGNSEALSEAERQDLLDAVRSVDQASLALAQLAQELPQTAERMSERLPQAVREARAPIAELSSGLASARDGIYAITESLPEASENAKQLIDAALDAALIRISTYSVILIAVLALALIGVFWFVYRQYIAPLAQKLDALSLAPEHFANLALYMQKTSENLLALQAAATETSSEPPQSPPAEPSPERKPDTAEADSNRDEQGSPG